MDIQQLSEKVRELIISRDEVKVPGLGTFTAGIEPASFSDRGFTVNPPYRKLTFTSNFSQTEATEGLCADAAELNECVAALKDLLKKDRMVELPELGKIRLTASGDCFFVADQDLDIYPDGFGLQPVSMKNHGQPVEPEQPAAEPEQLAEAEQPAAEPEQPAEPVAVPEQPAEPKAEPAKPEPAAKPKKRHRALKAILWIIVVCVLALAAFRLAAMLAPDFIDSLLYTPEELQRLGK